MTYLAYHREKLKNHPGYIYRYTIVNYVWELTNVNNVHMNVDNGTIVELVIKARKLDML